MIFVQRRGRRRKPPVTLATVHDRRATELPANAKVASIEITDPYSLPGDTHEQVDDKGQVFTATGKRITVIRSLRDDPLGHMHARHQVDEAQFQAGRYWQRLTEQALLGNIQSVDTSKEPVDGGRFPDLLTDTQRNAIGKLRTADVALGDTGRSVIADVLGERLFIHQLAGKHGEVTERAVSNWSFFFRKQLDVLAEVFGFASVPSNRRGKIRGVRQ